MIVRIHWEFTINAFHEKLFWFHTSVLFSSPGRPIILLVNYDSCWQHQMSVRSLRHDRPSGRFSKSRGLSASVSFLSSPPPPRSFTCAIFRAVFDSRSSFFVPTPHGNACYAGRPPATQANSSSLIRHPPISKDRYALVERLKTALECLD